MIPARSLESYPPAREGWRLVAVLMMVSICGFIDRQILALLVSPIRRDLLLTDTQMSLLLGPAFVLCYTVASMPIGWLADTYSRRLVLAMGLTAWSLCTGLSGLVRSFGQLLGLRTFVGIGEASLQPCAFSLISDSFPEARRATALSAYLSSMSMGIGLAFVAGGVVMGFASRQESWVLPLVGAVRPWQLILLQVGGAGLIFSLLLLLLREPPRHSTGGSSTMSGALAHFGRNRRTLLCHHLAFTAFVLATSAGTAWIPEMFRRSFQWSIPRIGVSYGLEIVIFGPLGALIAGRLGDRLVRRGVIDGNMRVGLWITLLAIPVMTAAFLAPTGESAILFLAPGAAIMTAPFGLAAAALHQIVPAGIRSQASALYVMILNVVGSATGPTLTAYLTQHVFRREDALHYSLLVVHVGALSIAALLLWAGRSGFARAVTQVPDLRAKVD